MGYTLDDMVLSSYQVIGSTTSHVNGTSKIRSAMSYLQNARIILCTDYIAKDLQKVIHAYLGLYQYFNGCKNLSDSYFIYCNFNTFSPVLHRF